MRSIQIPGRTALELSYLLLDVNGTLTDRGELIDDVKPRLKTMRDELTIWLLSADTFGTLTSIARELDVRSRVVADGDEKLSIMRELGAARCAAIGNGLNDRQMLAQAALGIVVLGPEGAGAPTLHAADIVCRSIGEALDLLLDEQALRATLRH